MLCVTCIDMKPSDRLERVWSRQQGRWSVKGPDTFRLSSYLVGSNVHAIVSLCLARKYIYRQEICMLEWIGVDRSGSEWIGAEGIGVDWSGLEWIGVEWRPQIVCRLSLFDWMICSCQLDKSSGCQKVGVVLLVHFCWWVIVIFFSLSVATILDGGLRHFFLTCCCNNTGCWT